MSRTAAALLLAIAVVAVAAPWLSPRPPDLQEDVAGGRNLPPLTRAHAVAVAPHRTWIVTSMSRTGAGWSFLRSGARVEVPDADVVAPPEPRFYLLGTDGLGRDLTSRLLHGARHSFGIAAVCVLLSLVLGSAVGSAAALAGGWTDMALMRGVDALICLPRLVVFFACAAVLPPSTLLTVLVLAATTWTHPARLVRSEILALRGSDLAASALAVGCSRVRLVLAHLLPATGSILAVTAALRLADTILLESALSFLGLGTPAPAVSLGDILASGREGLAEASWIILWPGLLIAAVVAGLRSVASSFWTASEPASV